MKKYGHLKITVNLKKLQEENSSVEYRFIHDNLGSNFRITEMQSAIGRVQLKN